MQSEDHLLTSEILHMLVSSMTGDGKKDLTELEAERFINAVTRAQSGVTTVARNPNEQNNGGVKHRH